MASISREELIRLARTGAVARVQELQAELESIFETFPDLRAGAARGRAAKAKGGAAAAPTAKIDSAAKAARAAKTSRAWSASARKAVSERMKKYWAGRRAKAAKAAK